MPDDRIGTTRVHDTSGKACPTVWSTIFESGPDDRLIIRATL
ncbi:MAG TPA: hypothetical protein VEL72_00820 [Ktedonobacteraceae bacterium]|nr:hypothetical protein [Ktedonobacteraceae bacterium]